MKNTSFLFLLLFLVTSCFSNTLSFDKEINFYVDKENLNFSQIKNKQFNKLKTKQLNYGFNNKIVVWIKVELINKTNSNINTILEINNPLLEEITLYDNNGALEISGMLNISKDRETINPYFKLNLYKKSSKTYYMKIVNHTTALQFAVNFHEEKNFYKNDINKQFLTILFLGIISAFFIYAIVLFLYTKDESYLFYSLYIIVLVFQQLTYVGFLPLYMPYEFTYIDNLIVVPKVGGVIITGIIFARSFLKTKQFKKLDRFYMYIVYAVILQILFLSTPLFYYPEITVLTGLIFICFNMYASIYVYKKGNKQARFFIVGWSFLIIGFFLSIIDALGIYSVMYHFPSLVLVCTSVEAMFLLLAFVDKLSILQEQKNSADKKLFTELKQRNIIIEEQVQSRTKMLNDLYKELHHRVKNNLQIMLSIIRLQSAKFEDDILKEQFLKLENRIKSIAKTHEILYLNDDIEQIDMYEYLYSLCEDIDMSFNSSNINFEIDSTVRLPLREAVYIGIIINELVSNSMKYAKGCDTIFIGLNKVDDIYSLDIFDNGIGYDKKSLSKKTLGLKLVNNLVIDQLNGTIDVDSNNKSKYTIRFKI